MCKNIYHCNFKIHWNPATPKDETRGSKSKSHNSFDVPRECSAYRTLPMRQNANKCDGKEAFQQHTKTLPFCMHLLDYKGRTQIEMGNWLYEYKWQNPVGLLSLCDPSSSNAHFSGSHVAHNQFYDRSLYNWAVVSFNVINKCIQAAGLDF